MAARLQRLRRGPLSESFAFAGPAFRRAAPWLLVVVFFLGLLARSFPALFNAVWGSDSGEYIFLTQRLVETHRVSFDYQGWGIAYPYFPGLFVVSGAVTAVVGVDVFHAVLWTTPVLAGLLGVLVALLSYRITGDPRVAIVAGTFVAVGATTVITTSHAMPGTLGQVILLGMLALLPDAHKNRRHFALYAIMGVALVWTHHLTTYFAVGIFAFIPFYREITQRSPDRLRLRTEAGIAAFLLVLAAVWWLGFAPPFRNQIVGDALPFNPWVTALVFLVALSALPVLVRFKRARSDWFKSPRYPSFPKQRVYVAATFVALWALIAFVALVHVPGSGISISALALIFVIPILGYLAFLPLGVTTVRFYKGGVIPLAMMWAVLASLAFAVVTNSRIFFPFRHVDYLAMAMAPMAAIGMVMVYDQTLAARMPADRASARAGLITAFAFLVALALALSLPPRSVIGGFEEGISNDELDAVRWVKGHPDVVPPGSTIAADHRVSSLLWGLASAHPTWDSAKTTYHTEDASVALDDLSSLYVPYNRTNERVDYVFLSPQIEAGVTLLQWENSEPMSPAAIQKFDQDPAFALVYHENGVRIYRVNWG